MNANPTLTAVASLTPWVESVLHGSLSSAQQLSGGNRAISWAVHLSRSDGTRIDACLRHEPSRRPTVEPYCLEREASIYRALLGSGIRIPQFFGTSKELSAMLVELIPGHAAYRKIADAGQKQRIAQDFVRQLAVLHSIDPHKIGIPEFAAHRTITDSVRAELDIWEAMYRETDQHDPLVEFALDWLRRAIPAHEGPPVVVHGDAGPGNFMFEGERVTGVIDWEFCHAGDPMEDLAWYSMRAVMEPVPNFAETLDDYEANSKTPISWERLRYHRVFVSTRVVIIRHRDLSGLPGNSIVSRALNRRLLVHAIADAAGFSLPLNERVEAAETARTATYDKIIRSMRDDIVSRTADAQVSSAAKDASKALKFLRDSDRYGAALDTVEKRSIDELLGMPTQDRAEAEARLLTAIRSRSLDFERVLAYFAGHVARGAQLASDASGGLASRTFP